MSADKRVTVTDSGGNQGALNSGCVCDSGCESCDSLREAFEAMREVLHDLLQGKIRTPDKARAALALADKVGRP